MSASWEMQLLSAIVNNSEPSALFDKAVRSGITFNVFSGIEAKNLWSTIEAHYNRPHNFGHIPSLQSLEESFPHLDLPTPVENFGDLCEKVQINHLKRRAEKAVQTYLEDVSDNALEAVTDLYSSLGQIQEQTSIDKDVSFDEVAFDEVLRDMKTIEECNGTTGMPWPWLPLNTATGGIQEGDFIMVWAMPKSMKTWFGLIIAAHLYKTGRRVVVYSKEMHWDSLRRRLACILGKVNYTRYKENSLSNAEMNAVLEVLEELTSDEHTGNLVFTTADRTDGSPGGPAEIRRKIDIYRPHFVLLDSAYMLELPGAGANAYDWKHLALVNRQLKQIAKTTGVALLAILQEHERAAYKYAKSRGTASLAMNTSAVMDCDVGLRLVYHKKKREISIHFAAARETEKDGFTIHAIAAENFEYAHDHLHNVGDDFKEEAEQETTVEAPAEQTTSLRTSYRSGNDVPDEISEDLQEDD